MEPQTEPQVEVSVRQRVSKFSSLMSSTTFRTAISCLLVGSIAFGNSIQIVMQDGTIPSKSQFWSAIIGAALLMANDVKSRITPSERGHN